MKLRKILFLSAFLLAVAANFAFKSNSSWGTGYYYGDANICTSGDVVQDYCGLDDTGPACTIFDGSHHSHPAYAFAGDVYTCVYPLYQANL